MRRFPIKEKLNVGKLQENKQNSITDLTLLLNLSVDILHQFLPFNS